MAKQKQPEYLDKIDLNAIYQCNMVLKGTNAIEEKTDVRIIPGTDNASYKIIAMESDKYDEKYFYDSYIDWLMYTKYITKKEG